jgi:hypothetical protein
MFRPSSGCTNIKRKIFSYKYAGFYVLRSQTTLHCIAIENKKKNEKQKTENYYMLGLCVSHIGLAYNNSSHSPSSHQNVC